MQEAGETKVVQSISTYRITEDIFYQEKSNRMFYNSPNNRKNDIDKEHQSQIVNVNGEFRNSYRTAVKRTEATGISQKKKKLHVHFAEPLVTYQYFNSEGLITKCPVDEEKMYLEENLDQLSEAKQKYDTELIGVRKLVNALPNNPDITGATIQQKRALLKRLEDLGEAVERSQKAFEAELEAEREKNLLLKQKLRKRKVSHNKECLRYKTELLNAKVQADVLRLELERKNQQKVLLQEELELELANAKMLSESLQGQLAEEIHLKNTLIMYFKELAAIVSSSPHNSTEQQTEREELRPPQEEQDHFKVLCKRNRLKYETDPSSAKQQEDAFHCRRQAVWPKDLLQEGLQTTSCEAEEDNISENVRFKQQDCRHDGGAAEMREVAPSLWNAIWYIVGLWRPQR